MELDTRNFPTVSLSPQDVFFSTPKIRSKFNNGKRLIDAIEDIRTCTPASTAETISILPKSHAVFRRFDGFKSMQTERTFFALSKLRLTEKSRGTVRLAPTDFPWICVLKQGDQWISLDNRRLYVFRMAQVDEINCINCTESEVALAQLSSNLARFSKPLHEKTEANSSSKVVTEREHIFSQLTQKWVDSIVSLDAEKLLSGASATIQPSSSTIPISFSSAEEYSSLFYDFLRVEAAEKLMQSLQAIHRSGNVPGARDRYPGQKLHAQIVKYQPRAAKDNFKADIVVARMATRLSDGLRVQDCVFMTWNNVKSPGQLGVITFVNEEAGEVQIKLSMPFRTADSVDAMLLRKESISVTIQAIDNVVTQMRVAAALQWPHKPRLFSSLMHITPTDFDDIRMASLGDLESWAESQMTYNNSQMKAIQAMAHDANTFLLVQGPPGTGKTATIMGACASLIYQGKRVLVTSPSNHAVDSVRNFRIHWSFQLLLMSQVTCRSQEYALKMDWALSGTNRL
jgi:hypothetical protein